MTKKYLCPEDFALKRQLRRIKERAKKKNLEFNLTFENISPVPSHCPILGIPLLRRGPRDNQISIDRVNNSKGYTNDNIIICSRRANRIKNDGNVEEHRKIVNFLEKFFALRVC